MIDETEVLAYTKSTEGRLSAIITSAVHRDYCKGCWLFKSGLYCIFPKLCWCQAPREILDDVNDILEAIENE